MSRAQLLFISLLLGALQALAQDMPRQVYCYDIQYHCAFINGTAAHATIDVGQTDGQYYARLSGRSRLIGDTFYCINDTLQSTFSPQGAMPTENVQYISGYYRKPHPNHYVDPDSESAYRNISGGGLLSASHATMECVHLTAEMLCFFYYAKNVDFASLSVGEPVDVAVIMPDGDQRTMQVVYHGAADFNGRNAYHLIVNFTYGESLSQYPISVMVDQEWRVPLQFAASIDIGEVQMNYIY